MWCPYNFNRVKLVELVAQIKRNPRMLRAQNRNHVVVFYGVDVCVRAELAASRLLLKAIRRVHILDLQLLRLTRIRSRNQFGWWRWTRLRRRLRKQRFKAQRIKGAQIRKKA